MTSQVAVRQTKHLLCTKSGQGDTAWGVGSQKPVKEYQTVPAPTVRTKLHNCNIYAICPGESHASSLVGSPVSVNRYETRVVDSVSFYVVFLTPLAPANPFPSLQQDSLNCLMFGYESVSLKEWPTNDWSSLKSIPGE